MELELGLSITNCTFHIQKIPSLKELDLINYVNCVVKQDDCCDDNSSILSYQSSCVNVNDGDYGNEDRDFDNGLSKKKSGFSEVDSDEFCMPKTLPLLFWDNQPNEDDHEQKRLCNSPSFTITINDGDEIVGWPPIKTYRKKQNDAHHQQRRGRNRRNISAVENGGLQSMYVKVQMEGCLLTRKINLKLYNSYDVLTSTLLHMFAKGRDSMDDYKLTYQDGEGDWLLAGDVPWRTFIRSVRRLKMVRRDC